MTGFWILRTRRGIGEKHRGGKKNRVFTNSLLSFKIRKVKFELFLPPT
jgi:hypothetical protein